MWKDTVMSEEESWEVYQANGGRGVPPREQVNSVSKAQAEITWDTAIQEALIRVGREAKRMDKTTYLVPDYKKYRQALKDEGVE